ncbi:MAG: efflux RND transporter periplasmic adaptor subunit [Planctomycetota bacterium]
MKTSRIVTFVIALVACVVSFWAGRQNDGQSSKAETSSESTKHYCSMHPHITLPGPGKCSICKMDLIPLSEAAGDDAPRTLSLSPAAMQLAEIETSEVRREFVKSTVLMVGKIEFDETEARTITARVPGRLDRLYVDYTGVPVAKGDHLADIYSPVLYEAQQQLLEALKSVKASENGSERVKASSVATLDAVRKRLRLLGLDSDQIAEIETRKTPTEHLLIRSTVGGVVIDKYADVGGYVETGSPLYRVVSLANLWVKLDAYESDLRWLRYGQEVSFQTATFPGETFRGKVRFIDWTVDERTRTTKIRLNVDNADGRLKPGMLVRASAESTLTAGGRVMEPTLAGKWISPMHPEIVKDAPGTCDVCGMDLVQAEKLYRTTKDGAQAPLVIPASAPLITGKRAVVYVKDPEKAGTFQGRDIVLGPRAGDRYVVLSGLESGERVVTRGSFKIDSALQIRAEPSMMNAGDPKIVIAPPFRATLDSFVTAYLAVSDALVRSDLSASKQAFTRIEKIFSAASPPNSAEAKPIWSEIAAELQKTTKAASSAENLAAVRVAFASLTALVKTIEDRFGHAKGILYETHCPMAFDNKGGSWYQLTPQIANPYFGDAMLRCGEVKNEHRPLLTGAIEPEKAKSDE